MLITQMLLLLPLMGMLITYFPTNLSRVVLLEAVVFFSGVSVFWSGLLYQKDRDLDETIKIVFAFSILAIVLILFKIPIWVLGCLSALIGAYWWWKYYYRFEHVSITK